MDPLRCEPLVFSNSNTLHSCQNIIGVTSLKQYCKSENELKQNENLLSCGLTAHEIELYNDYNKGLDYFMTIHKNIEKSILNTTIQNIILRINHSQELRKDVNNLQHSIKSQIIHPIENLNELKNDLFPYDESGELPQLNKQRKFLRRMNRKLNKSSITPYLKKSNNTIEKSPHSYNDFLKSESESNKPSLKYQNSSNNSKWDKINMDINETKIIPKNNDRIRKIGCSQQTWYTIKNNQIIKLNNNNTNPIITNINEENESLINVNKKLSLNDIKKIPKFENYDAGIPSKILFLKNISCSTNDEDLTNLLIDSDGFQNVRLMKGKMKGQAFANFNSVESASKILEEKNGMFLKGKPIIIQYGKKHN